MTMELDTGAAVSVISEHTYHSTWPHDRPAILNQTADIQWRGVGSDWQHFCMSELRGPAGGATPFSGSRHGCQPVGSELAPKDPPELAGDTPAAADTCTSGNLTEVCRGI